MGQTAELQRNITVIIKLLFLPLSLFNISWLYVSHRVCSVCAAAVIHSFTIKTPMSRFIQTAQGR